MKSKKSNKNLNKNNVAHLFQNQAVLYIISILAFINVFGLMMAGNVQSVIAFIIVAIITFMFSKNMAIVLLVPLILVNLFMGGQMAREGLESMDKSESETEDESATEDESTEASKDSTMKPSTKKAPSSVDSGSASAAESFEVGRKTKDKLGSAIDYSSTLEQAYDNLDKILGSDGIKNLTGDTQKLMQQQQKLADTMQGLGPMIENATSMMQSLTKNGGMDKMMGMADGLKGMMGGAK